MKLLARQDELEEIAGAIGQTFLGLTVNCARCHDHKYDPIETEDYYGLVAAIDGVRHGSREVLVEDRARDLADLDHRISELSDSLAELDRVAVDAIRAARTSEPRSDTSSASRSTRALDLRSRLSRCDGTRSRARRRELRASRTAPWSSMGKSFVKSVPLRARSPREDSGRDGRPRMISGSAAAGSSPWRERTDSTRSCSASGIRSAGWPEAKNFRRTKPFARRGRNGRRQGAGPGRHHVRDGWHDHRLPKRTALWRALQELSCVTSKPETRTSSSGFATNPAAGTRFLTGRILEARLFDRALTPDEVAALAGVESDFVSEADVIASLSSEGEGSPREPTEGDRGESGTPTETRFGSEANDLHGVAERPRSDAGPCSRKREGLR